MLRNNNQARNDRKKLSQTLLPCSDILRDLKHRVGLQEAVNVKSKIRYDHQEASYSPSENSGDNDSVQLNVTRRNTAGLTASKFFRPRRLNPLNNSN